MALTFSLSRQDVSFGAELVILTRLARWLAFRCGPRSERSRDLGEAPTRNPGRSEPFEKVGGGDGGFYSSVQDFEIAEFMRLRILTFDTVLTLDSKSLFLKRCVQQFFSSLARKFDVAHAILRSCLQTDR